MDRERRIWNKEEIPGSGRSMRGYILHTPGSKGKTFVSSGFSTEGIVISASAVPHSGKRSLVRGAFTRNYERKIMRGKVSPIRTSSSSALPFVHFLL